MIAIYIFQLFYVNIFYRLCAVLISFYLFLKLDRGCLSLRTSNFQILGSFVDLIVCLPLWREFMLCDLIACLPLWREFMLCKYISLLNWLIDPPFYSEPKLQCGCVCVTNANVKQTVLKPTLIFMFLSNIYLANVMEVWRFSFFWTPFNWFLVFWLLWQWLWTLGSTDWSSSMFQLVARSFTVCVFICLVYSRENT
jgi:hypothetical protein